MEIIIKPLAPDMAEEYTEYFTDRAFADGDGNKGCYCVWHHWTEECEQKRAALPENERPSVKREYAASLIKKGRLNGFAAYTGGKMAGFCNADDKEKYFRHSRNASPALWKGISEGEKVFAIVCYTVDTALRGKGIASALLDYACSFAEGNGFDYIEAYPAAGEFDPHQCGGPLSMYLKRGFYTVKSDGSLFVRKKLG